MAPKVAATCSARAVACCFKAPKRAASFDFVRVSEGNSNAKFEDLLFKSTTIITSNHYLHF